MPIPRLTISQPFAQMNQQVSVQGIQKTSQIMQEVADNTRISSMGNGTRVGTSPFQQSNKRVTSEGMQASAATMQQVEDTLQISHLGNYTRSTEGGGSLTPLNVVSQERVQEAYKAQSQMSAYANQGGGVGGNVNVAA